MGPRTAKRTCKWLRRYGQEVMVHLLSRTNLAPWHFHLASWQGTCKIRRREVSCHLLSTDT